MRAGRDFTLASGSPGELGLIAALAEAFAQPKRHGPSATAAEERQRETLAWFASSVKRRTMT